MPPAAMVLLVPASVRPFDAMKGMPSSLAVYERRLFASTTLRSTGGFGGGSCSCRTSVAASFDHLVSPGEKRLQDGALGIDQVTLGRWKTRHKEFRSAIEHGKTQADAEIAESLFNRARGYRHEATKIFMPAGSEAP